MLTGDQRHLLQIDGKYGRYTFCDMTIGSSKGLVLEIDIKRFTKLFPSDTCRVFTKTCETITKTVCVGLNPTETNTLNSVKRGKPRQWKVVHYSKSEKRKNEPSYVVPMTQNDYSLTYRPGKRFYNSERFSKLCA
jgi:hypothetical protein